MVGVFFTHFLFIMGLWLHYFKIDNGGCDLINKKIILVMVVLLVVVGVGYLVYSSFNSNNDLNVTHNSTVNESIANSSLNVNNSSNVTNATLDDDYSYSESDSHSYHSSKSMSNESSDVFTASDAMDVAKKRVAGVEDYDISELNVGKPKYKAHESWLVPFYHKKTGKFVGSTYVSPNMVYGGIDDSDDYKRVISGKEPKKRKIPRGLE